MAPSYAVVDGSNIATEGRSVPSLAQLDDAVRQFQAEFPGTEVIVVVDATFGHRIDPSERKAFDEAVSHAELVSPPAGAVGRGDAFLLRVAERVGAQVLSNDSFQEFHAEHPWLFDEGRLIGGKPVPGVGWIFTPRSPVRGVRSRSATSLSAAKTAKSAKAAKSATTKKAKSSRDGQAASVVAAAVAAAGADVTAAGAQPARAAKKTKKVAKAEAAQKEGAQKKAPAKKTEATQKPEKAAKKTKKTPEPPSKSAKVKKAGAPEQATKAARRSRARRATAPDVRAAIDVATVEAIAPDVDADGEAREPRARRRAGPPAAVNDPLTFLTFVSEHPIGAMVEGTVSSFVSHGAMVDVGGMQCYVPLAGLAVPAPRRAREVLDRGQVQQFVLVALDPARRGAELALPEVAAQRMVR
jgi:hypothetical protein